MAKYGKLSGSEAWHRDHQYSVGSSMFLQIQVLWRTYKIGRGRRKFFETSRLLDWFVRLRCRLAGPVPLPVWLARLGWLTGFRCPANLIGSAKLLVGTVRLPGWLIRLGCPAVWLCSTNLIAGSVRPSGSMAWLGCLARVRRPTGWPGSSARPAGSVYPRIEICGAQGFISSSVSLWLMYEIVITFCVYKITCKYMNYGPYIRQK